MDYLVREGDSLPAKGTKKFRAGRKIRAGSSDSINFKLYQGEIEDKISDNLFIGALKISGEDFEFGTILEGTEIICDYTLDDAGSINLEIDIPAVSESFYKNFYSREEGQLNFDKAADKLNRDGKNLLEQVRELGRAIENNDDYGKLKQAAKKILADIRERNRESIRREDLNDRREYYNDCVKKFAKPQEITQIENLLGRAEDLIEREDSAYEDIVKEISGLCREIIFRRDNEYVAYPFNSMIKNPSDFNDQANFYRLAAGKNAVVQKDFNALRKIIFELWALSGHSEDEFLTANIIKA